MRLLPDYSNVRVKPSVNRLALRLVSVALVLVMLLGLLPPMFAMASDTSDDIVVSFRLIGSTLSTGDIMFYSDIPANFPDYKGAEYQTWIATKTYVMQEGDSVYDLFVLALADAGLSSVGQDSNYVSAIFAPDCLGGYRLAEFTNGFLSGWMYTVNDVHVGFGLKEQPLADGDVVIWHYINDYLYEVEDWFYGTLGDNSVWSKWLDVADVDPLTPKPLSDDATLSSLTVSAGVLSPVFTSNVFSYSVTVPNNVNSIVIGAIANDETAVVFGAGTRSLVVGENVFTITATAEDGDASLNYTVTVTRAGVETPVLSADASLASLTVSEGKLVPMFDAKQFVYAVNVENDIDSITINAAANDKNAKATGDIGNFVLNIGDNTFKVVVTAEDSVAVKTYTVVITRKAATAVLPIDVDKTILNAAIVEAQGKLGSAQVGTGQGQYPQVAVNALTNAISVAQNIADDTGALQVQVDNTVAMLTAVVTVFEAAKIPEQAQELPTVMYKDALSDVLSYISSQVKKPQVDSVGGEWAVIALNRGGVKNTTWNNAYLDTLEAFLKDPDNIEYYDSQTGAVRIHRVKVTDNERVILALTSIGVDASNFRGFDLVAPLLDKDSNGKYTLAAQGVNGVIFALIALDSGNYLSGTNGRALRQWCIDYLLDCQHPNGGWNLQGIPQLSANSDITGMALQALAPYYENNAQVSAAVKKAVSALQNMQESDGSFSYGSEGKTSESAVQVLVALTALDYDGTNDGSFIRSVIENLLTYRVSASGGFRHTKSGSVDQMASEQAAYALVAYDRYVNGKNTLYDMSETTLKVDNNKNTTTGPDLVVKDLEGVTGIFVTAKSGVLSTGVELEVIQRTSGEKYDKAKTALKGTTVTFLLFDITLLKNNEEIHSFGGEKITVSIPVPKGYDGAKCTVYYIDEKGNAINMKAKLSNDCLVFDTDHLSLYAITQTGNSDSSTVEDSNGSITGSPVRNAIDSTDQNNSNIIWWLLVGGSLSLVGVLVGVLLSVLIFSKNRKTKNKEF